VSRKGRRPGAVPLLPELPYRLPDGSVVEAVEDLEVGVMRAYRRLQVLDQGQERDRAEIARYRQAAGELTLLLKVQGQKYEKRRAHSLLVRAAEALADSDDSDDAELAAEIEAYLQPRLARHPEELEVAASVTPALPRTDTPLYPSPAIGEVRTGVNLTGNSTTPRMKGAASHLRSSG
jgi:hypothetical protein